jgi:hypothetical protein
MLEQVAGRAIMTVNAHFDCDTISADDGAWCPNGDGD